MCPSSYVILMTAYSPLFYPAVSFVPKQAPRINILSITDFAAVEALVDATHRYKEIFYESVS